MNWHQADQFFDIFAAPLACCWRLRTIDSMDEFGDGHRRKREIDWPVHAEYRFDKHRNGLLVTFGADYSGGVQH